MYFIIESDPTTSFIPAGLAFPSVVFFNDLISEDLVCRRTADLCGLFWEFIPVKDEAIEKRVRKPYLGRGSGDCIKFVQAP